MSLSWISLGGAIGGKWSLIPKVCDRRALNIPEFQMLGGLGAVISLRGHIGG